MLKEIHEQPDAVAETITDRLPGDDRWTSRSSTSREDFVARRAADRDRRLRHQLPRRPGRAATRSSSGRASRSRWTSPPSTATATPSWGRRPGDRHHPVGRDGRHAGGHAARAGARREGDGADQHHGEPGDPRRRHRPVHARRARDRRRGDQDLHRAGGGDVPAGAVARAVRGTLAAGADRRADRRAEGHPVDDRPHASSRWRTGSARSPRPSTRAASSSTSGGTSVSRCASRGR